MRVRDVMRSHVVTLSMFDALDVATDIMTIGRIRHLPVVDRDHTLVGIVSQRDLLKASISSVLGIGESAQREWLGKVPVIEVMTRNVTTVDPDASVSEAMSRLIAAKIGCLPVVDESGKMAGLVTETDFLRCFNDLMQAGRVTGLAS
jgi:CBS domain-containing membrane protein